MIFTDFDQIPPLRYGLIMADPPWKFVNYSAKGELKSGASKYRTMPLHDIAQIPVSTFADRDCLLWLWCTNPMLPQGLAVLQAWGFTFKTAGHWCKRTKHGKLAFGTGYVLRSAGEPFLIGTLGKPKTSRSIRSVIEGPVREHSRKPDEAYAAAESLVPSVRRLDLFSRQARPGWDAAGDEVEKFEGPDLPQSERETA